MVGRPSTHRVITQYTMASGKCFKCGSKGHWARDCSGDGKKKTSPQRTPGKKSSPLGSCKGEPPAKRRKQSPEMQPKGAKLSPMQEEALNAVVVARKNVFLTGSAGVGKSFLLNAILRALRGYRHIRHYVTASTGVAAVPLQGTTLHSFAGVGMGEGSFEELLQGVRAKRSACERWNNCDVLVVDEVSMVPGPLWEKLDKIARAIRGKPTLPFGGIQLVLCGDFLQLPPVTRSKESLVPFAFETDAWRQAALQVFTLTEPYRQRDIEFVSMLNAIRCNDDARMTAIVESLNSACVGRESNAADSIKPTKLYPHRHNTDQENQIRLAALPGEVHAYDAVDQGEQPFLDMLTKNCIAPARIELKEGAQVLLTWNLDLARGLCNGSRGCVVGFSVPPPDEAPEIGAPLIQAAGVAYPVVLFANGERELITPRTWEIKKPGMRSVTVASRTQISLITAWAMTIHKCQGMTIPCVDIDPGLIFECGQAYVALSRVCSLEGLRFLAPLRRAVIRADPRAVEYYKHPY